MQPSLDDIPVLLRDFIMVKIHQCGSNAGGFLPWIPAPSQPSIIQCAQLPENGAVHFQHTWDAPRWKSLGS